MLNTSWTPQCGQIPLTLVQAMSYTPGNRQCSSPRGLSPGTKGAKVCGSQTLKATYTGVLSLTVTPTSPMAGPLHTCTCLQETWGLVHLHAIPGPEDRLMPPATTSSRVYHLGARGQVRNTHQHQRWCIRSGVLGVDMPCLLLLVHTIREPGDIPAPSTTTAITSNKEYHLEA